MDVKIISIVQDMLALLKECTDDEREKVLAEVKQFYCLRCGAELHGERCWGCYGEE